MSDLITLSRTSTVSGTVRRLPASKSLSNRALVIQALMLGAGELTNLSEANDTQLMKRLLNTPADVIDAEDAGTVLRFLTAYLAVTGHACTLTGTRRMQKRPVGELVVALQALGASIEHEGAHGYPPLRIGPFMGQKTSTLPIRGDISSQFISALMMVAPVLPQGLTLTLTGRVGSKPYLAMTASLMKHFGVSVTMEGNIIQIPAGAYQPAAYRVEPDWSAASYWFAMAALAEKADILLPGVASPSLQGDRVIVDLMAKLGVVAAFEEAGLQLRGGGKTVEQITIDFTDCPDLAQTILPVCAVKGVKGTFTGMESLRIKETDRISALRTELAPLGATLTEGAGTWSLTPGPSTLPSSIRVKTYEDHRMAMGFAPLAARMDVDIEEPGVVKKSYPGFWEDLRTVGISTQ